MNWVVAASLLVWLAACGDNGIRVTVTNRGQHAIGEVHVRYAGGRYELPSLGPGASDRQVIHPGGPSELTLRYRGPKAQHFGRDLQVVFGPGDAGRIDIDIHERGEVRFSSDL